MTPYFCVFMYSNSINSCHKIKGQISYHNESNQKFWHHTFCVFMSLLPFDFSWSFSKKTRGNHWLHFDAKTDTTYSSQIDLFLDFWWSFSKKLEEDFSWIFSKKNYMSLSLCVTMCSSFFVVQCFWFVLDEASAKKLEQIFNDNLMSRLWYKVLL